jgi:hypothetical protein
MISVILSVGAHDMYEHHVGKFTKRKQAFRESKRAAGIPNVFVVEKRGFGYSGPNGTAWIVE